MPVIIKAVAVAVQVLLVVMVQVEQVFHHQ
jgi:hypothetical protein